MIEKYLTDRFDILSEQIKNNEKIVKHNKNIINENKKKIKELQSVGDEAINIFSLKAREEELYKHKEADGINEKVDELTCINKKTTEKNKELKKEIDKIKKALDEYYKLVEK